VSSCGEGRRLEGYSHRGLDREEDAQPLAERKLLRIGRRHSGRRVVVQRKQEHFDVTAIDGTLLCMYEKYH
jgi:hypothetical protein